jgi:hypothetical protein
MTGSGLAAARALEAWLRCRKDAPYQPAQARNLFFRTTSHGDALIDGLTVGGLRLTECAGKPLNVGAKRRRVVGTHDSRRIS